MQVLDELAFKIISTIGPTRLVIGLSGGADSTLVLLIANRVRQLDPRYKVLAVHCIHGLDEDDPIWFNHCTALCKSLDVDLVTPKLNPEVLRRFEIGIEVDVNDLQALKATIIKFVNEYEDRVNVYEENLIAANKLFGHSTFIRNLLA